MKKICLLMTLLGSFIYAGDLENNNLLIKSSQEINSRYETVITTPESGDIIVLSDTDLTTYQKDLISKTYETFYRWDELKIKESQMIFEDRKLSIIIKPKMLFYQDIEITPFLPSGIQLYYETFYEYDFRMFKDLFFMRLKGQFYLKEDFLNEIFNAVSDPILYVQIHDPSYLIRQIEELKNINTEQDKTTSTLQEYINNLEMKHLELLEMYQKLSNSLISLNNRSFLGSLIEFNQDHIKDVVKLKTETPTVTVKEVISILKTSDIKVSSKLVESVFMVYFGEFPQNKE